MAINPDNLLGQSNPNGTVGVSLGIDPIGANEAFSAGVTSGFQVVPTSPVGMSVEVGGQAGVVDSALVRSVSGITFPVGNTSGNPITLTVPAAPTTNSRIDSVVLYVDTTVTATEPDGADALGIEIVSGTSASSPVAPTDAQIRSAIQNGASIAYVVIANITVASGATTITASDIAQATPAQVGADKVDFATIDYTLTAGVSLSSNNSFAQSWGKIGILNVSCRTSSNIGAESQVKLFTSNIRPAMKEIVTYGTVVNGNALTVNLEANGDIVVFSHGTAYGNWIRCIIPFFVAG